MVILNIIRLSVLGLIFFLFTANAFAVSAVEVNAMLSNDANASLVTRITNFSQLFLNAPYQLEPLGEGVNGEFNQEPLYRFDQFDCETYVDTVLALSLASNWQDFQQILLQLRYKTGVAGFLMRNHFPEADWLPNITNKNYAEDITTAIASTQQLVTITALINRQRWVTLLPASRIKLLQADQHTVLQQLALLHQQANQLQNTTVTLTYIKTDAVKEISQHIPNGAIILIVNPALANKQKQIGTNLLISHMGFAIWQNQVLYLRAASSLQNRVADIPLIPYLNLTRNKLGIIVLVAQNQRH